jgi:hypothetical protein
MAQDAFFGLEQQIAQLMVIQRKLHNDRAALEDQVTHLRSCCHELIGKNQEATRRIQLIIEKLKMELT